MGTSHEAGFVTLAPLSTADARLPGSAYGSHTAYRASVVAPTDYGRDRIGECGHILCRYNPGPECWPCEYARNRHDPSASAGAEGVTNAAPAGRAMEGAA